MQLTDDEICLMYIQQKDMGRAQKALMQLVVQEAIPLQEGFDELVSSAEWKRLSLNQSSSGSVQIFTDVRDLI